MSKYAIFQMSSNGQGGYDLCDIIDDFLPTEDKKHAEHICQEKNECKTDSWHYFQVFEINEKGQALSPSSGEIIHQ